MLTISSALIKCFKRDIQPNTQPNTPKVTAVKTTKKARSKKYLTTGNLTLVLGSGLDGFQLWTECFSSYDGVKVKRISEPFKPAKCDTSKLERVLFQNRNNLTCSRFMGLLNRIAWFNFKGANKLFGTELNEAFWGTLALADHYVSPDTIEGLYHKLLESYVRILWRDECDKYREYVPFDVFCPSITEIDNYINKKKHSVLRLIDQWHEEWLDKLTSPAMVA